MVFKPAITPSYARKRYWRLTAVAVCIFALVFTIAGKRKSRGKSDCHVAVFSDGEYSLKSYLTGAAEVVGDLYGCKTGLLEAASLTNYTGQLPVHPETIAEAAVAGASCIIEIEPNYDELRGEGLQGYEVTLYSLPEITVLFSSVLPTDGRFEPLLKRQLRKEKVAIDKQKPVSPVAIADRLRQDGSLKAALQVYEYASANADDMDPGEAKRALEQIASLKTELGKDGSNRKLPALGSFVHVEYGQIRREYKDAFNGAVDEVDMSDQLAGVSDNPAVLILKPFEDDDRELNLVLKVDFNPQLYWQTVAGSEHVRSGLRILHLKPFHNLMYRVLRLQGAFLEQLGEVERKQISKLRGTLLLVRSNGMEAEWPIRVGKNTGKLLQPSKIWLRASPKDKKASFEAASKRIFDRYGEFAIGSFKTKQGKPTRWAIIDRFFELSKHS